MAPRDTININHSVNVVGWEPDTSNLHGLRHTFSFCQGLDLYLTQTLPSTSQLQVGIYMINCHSCRSGSIRSTNCNVRTAVPFRRQTTQNSNITPLLVLRGGHSKQDLRYTQKPIYFIIFTNNVWSYLPWSPVIVCPPNETAVCPERVKQVALKCQTVLVDLSDLRNLLKLRISTLSFYSCI